jgi:hypothetical protein
MPARIHLLGLIAALVTGLATPAAAVPVPFFSSTGNPDGLMAMGAHGPNSQIEAADDFVTTAPTTITGATFTGLITSGVPLSNIGEVNIDLYHVFPIDSDTSRTPNVLSRVNSPADTEFDGRNSTTGTLVFTPGLLNPSFHRGQLRPEWDLSIPQPDDRWGRPGHGTRGGV